ncbi:EAL domain-containing response regulator [Egbenema bharatensis]|uniref:EAL domain-containing response regulator n=1 Tax=Egbenema bharatensis TaxID=3463334 RepID=UPI003A8B74FB
MTATEKQYRLLILDDDAAVGMTIAAIAATLNFETRATLTAADFFQVLSEWQPTHIALDLVMPEVDGIEVMRRLGEQQSQVAIVITSGVGSRILDAAYRLAMEQGLNVLGTASKPFRSDDLRRLLTCNIVNKSPLHNHSISPERLTITPDTLYKAINRHQFDVWYQPKIFCQTGKLAGFEALVRWHHPELGLVMPDRFIPLAEECGAIEPLTEQILTQALRWFSTRCSSPEELLSLNISAKSLSNILFADRVAVLCQHQGVQPQQIILEVTETSAMSDPVASLDVLTRFRLKGLNLSIDDFGIGYSSLIQLARLPFSELKIDKMFVTTAMQSDESRTIIKAIVGLGNGLGLRVTAEGVENEPTLQFLRDVGCNLAQGYFIARPMPAAQAFSWQKPNWATTPHDTQPG